MRKIRCPYCGGIKTMRIIYGFPSYELFLKEEKGLIRLGGCCVTDDDNDMYCKDCDKDFKTSSIESFNGL
jgi:hypothetical protein